MAMKESQIRLRSFVFSVHRKTLIRRTVHFALCLLVGISSGGFLLLDIPLKWVIAFLGMLGTIVLMLVVRNPQRILLFELAFTVPIVFEKAFLVHPARFSWTSGVGIGLSDVLVLMLLLLFLAKLARRQIKISFFPGVIIPTLIWLVLSLLSLLAARDGQLVLIPLIDMFKMLLLCWVVASSIESVADITFVVMGLILSMLFQSIVGVYQGVTGHAVGLDFLSENTMVLQQDLGGIVANRVQGTMGFPNTYALYLNTVIPFGLALLFSRAKPSWKILGVLSLCLGATALIFSLSRSGWIAFLVIVSIVLTLAVRQKRLSLRAAALSACITLFVLLGLVWFGPDMIQARLTGNDYGAAYSRVKQAQVALAIIKDHPWVGVGLNNYSLVSLHYDPTLSGQTVVHNVYLLIAAETGLIGLLAFLGLLSALLFQAWWIINRARNDTVWVAGVGSFCAFVAVTLFSTADYSLLGARQVTIQFGLLAGLTAALVHGLDDKEKVNHSVADSSVLQHVSHPHGKKWVTTSD